MRDKEEQKKFAQELRKNATKEENHLWYDFLRTYPVQFNRQKPFGSYVVDFYCKKANIVIADLPCSGLGVIGKKTDIKYKMTPDKMKSLVELQREMLHIVCSYVKPQGRLIYSTCTIHRGENEENVAWFLKTHPEFSLEIMQQIFPKEEFGDGFFIANMRKS